MAKLEWDKVGERYYQTGTDHGVLYVATNGTYPEGVAWNGLTGVDENPSGAVASAQYADNIKYLELRSNEEFGATVTAYTYPDEFEECDGSAEPVDGMFIGQQKRKVFGMSYRTRIGNDTDGDDHGYVLHLVYGATASPSARSFKTVNESPEPIEFSWEITTTPVKIEGYRPVSHVRINSTKADATNLAVLESVLYGADADATNNVEARTASLPLPDVVKAILTTGQIPS
jgi:hypothetical protein